MYDPELQICEKWSPKKVKGQKQNVVMDTMGLVLMVVVTAASLPEQDSARKVLE
ncbi:MAG: hypothetical protein VKL39_00525 [Leptolyngbyaceae bacterium]|nr:hypothetical protein [Leptolyngbyaceae bacterium]